MFIQTMVIIIGICWLVIGSTSFIYMWTENNDLREDDMPLVLGAGLVGPIGLFWLLLVWLDRYDKAHPTEESNEILFKRRK